MNVINLIIPGVAVLLTFVLEVLIQIKNKTFNLDTARQSASTLAMYIAGIGALELVSMYEPQIDPVITPLASAFALAEGYRAVSLFIKGTGDRTLSTVISQVDPSLAKQINSTNQPGSDPFGAAKQ